MQPMQLIMSRVNLFVIAVQNYCASHDDIIIKINNVSVSCLFQVRRYSLLSLFQLILRVTSSESS